MPRHPMRLRGKLVCSTLYQTKLFDAVDAHDNIVSVMGVKWVIHDENLKETGMSKHERIICEQEKKYY